MSEIRKGVDWRNRDFFLTSGGLYISSVCGSASAVPKDARRSPHALRRLAWSIPSIRCIRFWCDVSGRNTLAVLLSPIRLDRICSFHVSGRRIGLADVLRSSQGRAESASGRIVWHRRSSFRLLFSTHLVRISSPEYGDVVFLKCTRQTGTPVGSGGIC